MKYGMSLKLDHIALFPFLLIDEKSYPIIILT